MRALITGGAGFIGSALVERMLAEGHTVDVVDDLSTGSLANLAPARARAERRLSFHQLDVRRADIVALAERQRPDVVFHLAAAAGDDGSFGTPATDAEIDVVGALNVLEACRTSEVTKIVFTSSAAMYGELSARQLPAKEAAADRPTSALSPRGVAKRAVGDYLATYRERYALEFSTLVLANVYGPGQSPRRRAGVVAAFAEGLVRGTGCTIDGDGSQTRDFVFVDDVVDALARAATRGGGLVVNIATGVETSVNGLYGMMAASENAASEDDGDAKAQGSVVHNPPRPGDRRRLALDPSRAALHLGWVPWTSLVEGVEATLSWWRAQEAG